MRRYQPALLGGLVIGVLSSLPIVSGANLCCCLWVVVGGLLSAYLRQHSQPEPLDASDAALTGLLAGVIGAALYVLATSAMVGLTGPLIQDQIRGAFEANPQMPPELRATLLNLLVGRNIILIMIAITFPVYAIFSMLGALLGLTMFKKTPPTPPPPPGAGLAP